METEFGIAGLAELQKSLDQFAVEMELKIMRGAMRAGAKVIVEHARRHINNRTGDLSSNMRVSTGTRRGVVKAKIFNEDFTAKWVELGTAAHFIRVDLDKRPSRMKHYKTQGRKSVKREFSLKTINKMVKTGSLKIGTHFVGASVAHPGARKKPFLRPALDTGAVEAVEAVAAYVRKRIEKEKLKLLPVETDDPGYQP